MFASKFPKQFRIYTPVENRMVMPAELEERGVTLSATGEINSSDPLFEGASVVQWCSGMRDIEKTVLFEGDICSVDCKSEFGSFVQGVAIVRWMPSKQQFIFHTANNPMLSDMGYFNISNPKKVGADLTNPELLAKIYPEETNGEKV